MTYKAAKRIAAEEITIANCNLGHIRVFRLSLGSFGILTFARRICAMHFIFLNGCSRVEALFFLIPQCGGSIRYSVQAANEPLS